MLTKAPEKEKILSENLARVTIYKIDFPILGLNLLKEILLYPSNLFLCRMSNFFIFCKKINITNW